MFKLKQIRIISPLQVFLDRNYLFSLEFIKGVFQIFYFISCFFFDRMIDCHGVETGSNYLKRFFRAFPAPPKSIMTGPKSKEEVIS